MKKEKDDKKQTKKRNFTSNSETVLEIEQKAFLCPQIIQSNTGQHRSVSSQQVGGSLDWYKKKPENPYFSNFRKPSSLILNEWQKENLQSDLPRFHPEKKRRNSLGSNTNRSKSQKSSIKILNIARKIKNPAFISQTQAGKPNESLREDLDHAQISARSLPFGSPARPPDTSFGFALQKPGRYQIHFRGVVESECKRKRLQKKKKWNW